MYIYVYIYYVHIICLMFAPSLPRLSRQCWFHGVRMQSSTGGFVRAKCSRWIGNSHRRWAILKSPWNFTEVPIFNMGAWSCASETLFGRLLICGAQRPAIPFLGASTVPKSKWVHLDKFIPKHWDWWPQQCDQDDLEAALYQWFAYKVTDVAELVWICEGWRQDHDFSTF